MHPTTIEINTQQFITNLQSIRNFIGEKIKLLLPVKANAYGHGLIGIAKLAEPYVDYLAVSCLDEGVALRSASIKKPILVFGAIDEDQIPGLVRNNLEITISSLYKARLVAEFCSKHNLSCKVHIKVDTGMNRVGIRVESLAPLADFIFNSPNLELVGLYSHLACSDEINNTTTNQQVKLFRNAVDYIKSYKQEIICHLANSGGVCYFPETYFDMVRPGLLSYGYFPAHSLNNKDLIKISPCFSLKSRVVYFKVLPSAAGISYNHRYYSKSLTRVVTIPIGYGDGYRRGLSNLGEVIIRGQKYLISGSICMDMLMVDIGPDGEAYVGDEVILIGNQGLQQISIVDIANKLNTIVYDILVGFNERIPRIYL